MVQGTNLQHALMLAGRLLDRHPDAEPVVLVVTDGEPTAHLLRDGDAEFCWPPLPETLELTLAEVERITRRGATINVFMLDDEPRLVDFVEEVARRNGGRVFSPDADRLGEYVVSDYLRARRRGRLLMQLARPSRAAGGGVGSVPSDVDGLFAAGTASYHRPDCRLVDGREEISYVTAAEAGPRPRPCRVPAGLCDHAGR